jgi:hypothetical protein
LVLAGGTAAVHTAAMRTLLFLAALIFAPAAHAQTLADLHWLKGCWRTSGDGPVITEVWSAPPMPAMLGYSYTIGEGEVQGWEQTRIEMIDGWPHFIAMPNGGAAVRFRMVEPGAPVENIVQFENLEHDFPKVVQYRREGNRLIASIFGEDASSEIRFNYRRISCAANLRP